MAADPRNELREQRQRQFRNLRMWALLGCGAWLVLFLLAMLVWSKL